MRNILIKVFLIFILSITLMLPLNVLAQSDQTQDNDIVATTFQDKLQDAAVDRVLDLIIDEVNFDGQIIRIFGHEVIKGIQGIREEFIYPQIIQSSTIANSILCHIPLTIATIDQEIRYFAIDGKRLDSIADSMGIIKYDQKKLKNFITVTSYLKEDLIVDEEASVIIIEGIVIAVNKKNIKRVKLKNIDTTVIAHEVLKDGTVSKALKVLTIDPQIIPYTASLAAIAGVPILVKIDKTTNMITGYDANPVFINELANTVGINTKLDTKLQKQVLNYNITEIYNLSEIINGR